MVIWVFLFLQGPVYNILCLVSLSCFLLFFSFLFQFLFFSSATSGHCFIFIIFSPIFIISFPNLLPLHPSAPLPFVFFTIRLCRFLTKREQQLMQRRHHAEELLQWKQQLDQEEAEVRRMEKEAMVVWKQKRARDKHHERPESPGKEIIETGSHKSHHQSFEATSDSEKGTALGFCYRSLFQAASS